MFARCYGVGEHGNFEGRNILHVPDAPAAAAADLGITVERLLARLGPMRRALFDARSRRTPPATDDKVLTAWNGLALRAFAEAAFVLDRRDYREVAERNAAFVLRELRTEGRLLRTWKDGRAHLPAYLEDYAFLIDGLLALHTATFSHRWLREARQLADEMSALFWDDGQETFYDVGTDHERLIVRPRDTVDNAIPSGSSAAAEALLRLGVVTGEDEYTRKGARLLRGIVPLAARYPLGFGNWLCAIDRYLSRPMEVVVVGDPSAEATKGLLRPVRERFLPALTFVGVDPSEDAHLPMPLTEGRAAADRPTAYVCHGYACDLPTSDPAVLAGQLDP